MYESDAIVIATGQLHKPSVPRIEGAGTFAGHTFHSAEWDHGLRLAHPDAPDEAQSTLEDALGAPALAETLAAFDHFEFTGGDQLRDTPVTIAWGRYDRLLIYSRQAPRARERLPSARHVTLGAGHVPFFDDPAAVAETIRLTVARKFPAA